MTHTHNTQHTTHNTHNTDTEGSFMPDRVLDIASAAARHITELAQSRGDPQLIAAVRMAPCAGPRGVWAAGCLILEWACAWQLLPRVATAARLHANTAHVAYGCSHNPG